MRKSVDPLILEATVGIEPLTLRNAATLVLAYVFGRFRRRSSKSTVGHGSTGTRIESRGRVSPSVETKHVAESPSQFQEQNQNIGRTDSLQNSVTDWVDILNGGIDGGPKRGCVAKDQIILSAIVRPNAIEHVKL